VSGVGEDELAGVGIEHRVQTGDEHLRRHVRDEEFVDELEHLAGRALGLRDRTDDASR
jgi:hypothetical protein